MEVYYYPSFLRQIKKMPVTIREAAISQTKMFIENPTDPALKLHKLTGRLVGLHAFSVDFYVRIVLEIKGSKAYFHFIGDHRIYR